MADFVAFAWLVTAAGLLGLHATGVATVGEVLWPKSPSGQIIAASVHLAIVVGAIAHLTYGTTFLRKPLVVWISVPWLLFLWIHGILVFARSRRESPESKSRT